MEREINIYRDNFIQNENGPQFNVAKLMRKSSFSRIGFDDKNYDLLSKQIWLKNFFTKLIFDENTK
jgi:hypothetical protein